MTNSDKAACTTVDELLLDAGHADVPELRAALLGLHSLADLPLPQPNAQLAAMLAPSADELARKRPLRRHRPTVVSVAVIAGMGLGVSGVAATIPHPGIRQGLVSVQNLDGGGDPGQTAPLSGTSVPISVAPARPEQSFQGPSSAVPDAESPAAEGSRATPPDSAKGSAGLAAVKDPPRSGRHVASATPEEKGQAWGPVAALPDAVVKGLDQIAKQTTASAPGQLPSGRHFSQTLPTQSIGSATGAIGTWLKKNRR